MSLNHVLKGTANPLPLQGSSIEVKSLQVTGGATNSYVLTSDASGNATWQAPSGGGGVTSVNAGDGTISLASGDTGAVLLEATGIFNGKNLSTTGTFTVGASTSLDSGGITTDGQGDLLVGGYSYLSNGAQFAAGQYNGLLFNAQQAPPNPQPANSYAIQGVATTNSINAILDDVKASTAYLVGSTRGATTQTTSITTSVTVNGSSGQVTTVSSTLAAQTSIGFSIISSYFTSNSQIVQLTFQYGGTTGLPMVRIATLNAGSNAINVTLSNYHPSAALNGNFVVHFSIS